MAKTITPSGPVTEGQIGKLNQNLSARLLKNKAELPSDLFQEILGDDTLIDEMYALICKRIETRSDMIVRVVNVNRNRSGKEAIKATGRSMYVTDSVVDAMPNGATEETEVVFFKLDRYVNDADLDKEYELRGLKPADTFSQAAVNEADPAFADEYPNGTHWKDKKDNWCFATFGRGGVERGVCVRRGDSGWDAFWWFAGVRK